MHPSAGQLPDQPAVYRAKSQFAFFGAGTHPGYFVEQPLQLGARKVGVQDQPGFLLDQFCVALLLERITAARGSPVLPDDGVGDRLAGLAVPQQRGLALVGDADGKNLRPVRY